MIGTYREIIEPHGGKPARHQRVGRRRTDRLWNAKPDDFLDHVGRTERDRLSEDGAPPGERGRRQGRHVLSVYADRTDGGPAIAGHGARSSVDFPAPFGPIIATTWPGATARVGVGDDRPATDLNADAARLVHAR